MSEFSLFIRNQAKEAERKLKVQFTSCAATVFLLVLRWMFLCCDHLPSPTLRMVACKGCSTCVHMKWFRLNTRSYAICFMVFTCAL
jgi:hypothetical protein